MNVRELQKILKALRKQKIISEEHRIFGIDKSGEFYEIDVVAVPPVVTEAHIFNKAMTLAFRNK
jgi:hypothetical protein